MIIKLSTDTGYAFCKEVMASSVSQFVAQWREGDGISEKPYTYITDDVGQQWCVFSVMGVTFCWRRSYNDQPRPEYVPRALRKEGSNG